jgi:hypothetical protein
MLPVGGGYGMPIQKANFKKKSALCFDDNDIFLARLSSRIFNVGDVTK